MMSNWSHEVQLSNIVLRILDPNSLLKEQVKACSEPLVPACIIAEFIQIQSRVLVLLSTLFIKRLRSSSKDHSIKLFARAGRRGDNRSTVSNIYFALSLPSFYFITPTMSRPWCSEHLQPQRLRHSVAVGFGMART